MLRPLSAFALACHVLEGPGTARERICNAARFLARVDPQTLPPERRRFVALVVHATEPAIVAVQPLDEATAMFFADEVRRLLVDLVRGTARARGSAPTLH